MFNQRVFHFDDLHSLSPQRGGSHKKNRRIIPLFARRAIRNGLDRDQPNRRQPSYKCVLFNATSARKRLPGLLELPRFLYYHQPQPRGDFSSDRQNLSQL
ncbi:hypothetical protein AGJ34_07725 [Cronobacter dublinensis subsp. dublinensis]|nr:hypothetical protein [Cronobacter dublinensis subsp. dublinensis]EGT5672906.1 hypothetical protein [Cronobacter dublinensis subsp. dublinensis]EGT5730936.1 hypothetical protein [Cronobacter dublinensis subsp. dublinensis]EGT5744137.1 hypothetical protein [Cronobacter dublinensis subsp. dublinensis]EGT5770383.1 hypothetical protein [Cronobacter dublinensis subsp. dublinensis]